MVMMDSRDAKNNFGDLLDTAQRERVSISQNGRPVAVVISQHEYERLQAMEDAFWAARADAALKDASFIGVDASATAVKELLHAAVA